MNNYTKINTNEVLDGNVTPQDLKMRAKACSTYNSTLLKSCSIYISGQWFSSATTPKNNGTYKVSKPNYSLEYGILDSRPFLLEDAQIFRSHACSKFSRLSKYTVYGFVFPRSRYVHRKPKRLKRPCLYYSNSSACRRILLSGGDISPHPGPAPNCQVCEKTVRKNQARTTCNVCYDLSHVK